jgi:hypothetical protein
VPRVRNKKTVPVVARLSRGPNDLSPLRLVILHKNLFLLFGTIPHYPGAKPLAFNTDRPRPGPGSLLTID